MRKARLATAMALMIMLSVFAPLLAAQSDKPEDARGAESGMASDEIKSLAKRHADRDLAREEHFDKARPLQDHEGDLSPLVDPTPEDLDSMALSMSKERMEAIAESFVDRMVRDAEWERRRTAPLADFKPNIGSMRNPTDEQLDGLILGAEGYLKAQRDSKHWTEKAARRGVQQYLVGTPAALAGWAGSMVGSESLRDWGFEARQRAQRRVWANPADVERTGREVYSDLAQRGDIGQITKWIAETLIALAPQLLLWMVPVGATRAIAGRLKTKGAVRAGAS